MANKPKNLPPLPFDPLRPPVVRQQPPPPPPPVPHTQNEITGPFAVHAPVQPMRSQASNSFIDDLERKQRDRMASRLKFAMSIISAVLAGGGVVYGILEERVHSAIEERVDPIKIQLDSASELATGIHEKHRMILEPTIEKTAKRLTKLEKETYELYRFLAGEKAADLERDRRKRARARDQAYRKFEYYVERGETLDDAYRKASGSPLLP